MSRDSIFRLPRGAFQKSVAATKVSAANQQRVNAVRYGSKFKSSMGYVDETEEQKLFVQQNCILWRKSVIYLVRVKGQK